MTDHIPAATERDILDDANPLGNNRALRLDDYSAEKYFADVILPFEQRPAMSASLAEVFYKKSPAAAYHAVNEGLREYKKHLVFGSVAHSMILREAGWDENIKVMPNSYTDYRSQAAREWRDHTIHNGGYPLKQSEYEDIVRMREAFEECAVGQKITAKGKSEVSVYWQCEDTGCICKVRWDFLPDDDYAINGCFPAFDYKTARELDGWAETACRSYGLQLRAALYYESLVALYGQPVNYAFLVQEKTAPFEMQCHWLGLHPDKPTGAHLEFIEDGRKQLYEIKQRFAECQQSQLWPKRRELVSFEIPVGLQKRLRDRTPAPVSKTRNYIGGAEF